MVRDPALSPEFTLSEDERVTIALRAIPQDDKARSDIVGSSRTINLALRG